MQGLFTVDWTGSPFVMFDRVHLITLGIILLFNLSFIFLRNSLSARHRHIFRIGVAVILLINEGAWHLWNLLAGSWSVQTMLPLHLCSVFVFLTSYMLLTRSSAIYEYAYFLSIVGAMQALLTPDVGRYGFPHFRYFQTFISHGLLFSMPIYFTIVEGFRPTWRSVVRVLVGMNLYMLFVGLVNWAIGSNYLFIAHKPETASLLDLLPAWPWYILTIEAIGILLILLLYLPFFIKDRLQRRHAPSTQP
jgi:hypothetical integral membrane protein (TIGR02206 family)